MSDKVVQKAIELAGDGPPEQEHFITAALLVGDDEEQRLAQRDLIAVEEGRSSEPLGYPEEDWDGYDDPAWCYRCNRDVAFCKCEVCPECDLPVQHCRCDECPDCGELPYSCQCEAPRGIPS